MNDGIDIESLFLWMIDAEITDAIMISCIESFIVYDEEHERIYHSCNSNAPVKGSCREEMLFELDSKFHEYKCN